MKLIKIIFISLLILSLHSCKKKSIHNNPYLQDVNFFIEINMDLPEYAPLRYANNSVLIQNVGIKGVIVFYTGNAYLAYEASDPNHFPNSCSKMIPNQFTCQCNCENNQYSLYTGQLTNGEGDFGLKPYHISQNANLLRISN